MSATRLEASTPAGVGSRGIRPGLRPRGSCREPSLFWIVPTVFVWWFVFLGPTSFVLAVVLYRFPSTGETFWDGNTIWTLAIAVRGVIAFVMTPFLGAVSDRWGRKMPMAFFTLVNGLIYVPLTTPATTSWRATAAVVLVALSGIAGNPMSLHAAYTADLVTPDRFSATYSKMLLWGYASAGVAAPMIANRLFSSIPETTWWILLAVTAANTGYVLFVLPESRWCSPHYAQPEAVSLNPFKYFRLLRRDGPAGEMGARILLHCSVVVLCLSSMLSVVIHVLGLYAMQVMAWPPTAANWLNTTFGVGQMVAMFCGPIFVGFFPDVRTMIWTGLSCGLAAQLLLCVSYQGWMLYAASVGAAICMGFTYTGTSSYAASLADPKMKGEVQGLLTSMISLSESIAPPIYGALLNWGVAQLDAGSAPWWYPNLSFFLAAVFVICGMIAAARLPHVESAVSLLMRSKTQGELMEPHMNG